MTSKTEFTKADILEMLDGQIKPFAAEALPCARLDERLTDNEIVQMLRYGSVKGKIALAHLCDFIKEVKKE